MSLALGFLTGVYPPPRIVDVEERAVLVVYVADTVIALQCVGFRLVSAGPVDERGVQLLRFERVR